MKKKLFEFRQALECAVVVAAETEEQARNAIKTWERAWIETGDFLGVQNDVPELVDVRIPKYQNIEHLRDVAHEVLP
jgi:hypothetical protein